MSSDPRSGCPDSGEPPRLSVLNVGYMFDGQCSHLILIKFSSFSLFSMPEIAWSFSLKESCSQGPINLGFLLAWASLQGVFSFQPAEDAVLRVLRSSPGGAGHCWELGIKGWPRPTRSSLLLGPLVVPRSTSWEGSRLQRRCGCSGRQQPASAQCETNILPLEHLFFSLPPRRGSTSSSGQFSLVVKIRGSWSQTI